MITNADLTVYNAVMDKDDGVSSYKLSHIHDINWQEELKVTVGEKSINSANVISICIPFSCNTENKTYLKPMEFANSSDKDSYFTFQNGDIVIKGICDDEIETLAKFRQSHDDVYTIMAVETFKGCGQLQHWELGAS